MTQLVGYAPRHAAVDVTAGLTPLDVTAQGCMVRRADCGMGPVQGAWEFISADGVNWSGRTFPTKGAATEYGLWRIGSGLEA